jgi:diguanylate cyclase (GGDEF)-like protein
MNTDFWPQAARPTLRNHLVTWAALVAFLLLGQLAATVLVPRSFSLTLINDLVEFLLISSALLVFLVNARAAPRQIRLFWLLLAACWGVTFVAQVMWMYFDLVLRKEVPNLFGGDILLFLSNIPFLAALLLQAHLDQAKGHKSKGRVDFLLLLLWWLYLYLFFVVPWQYVVVDEARNGLNYNRLNGLLDIVLLLTLGFLCSRSFGRWRWFYAICFAAQLLITVSGFTVNQAIDKHLYYPGSWYDLPYSVALASFTVVGFFGFTLAGAPEASKESNASVPVTRLGMLAVLSLPVMGAWTVVSRTTPLPVAQFRELLTLGTILVMAFLVFAKQHGMRIELATANRVLQEASATDPLTGARNRRFFDTTIAGDASQVLRSYQTQESRFNDLIFYMVDLDDFKEVNDRYGHSVGDKVLLEVTRRISSVIRSSDFLVRWGGDEFLIVSRFSNRAEAAAFASRIMSVVGNRETDLGNVGVTLRQTCSIGWAAFPWDPGEPDAVPLETVLGLADRGLYEAKTLGKNRAVGILPSDEGTTILFATTGDRVSTYCGQTQCVVGPSPPAKPISHLASTGK